MSNQDRWEQLTIDYHAKSLSYRSTALHIMGNKCYHCKSDRIEERWTARQFVCFDCGFCFQFFNEGEIQRSINLKKELDNEVTKST